ncbi:MAG: threonylcarbamoyl-AMP synthase [Muribaculaceae bacterium]|nr:threonylcarbamoyl-AMP synthase [Muribaculaceae bacterium]
MYTLRIWNSKATTNQLEELAGKLKQGEIAIIPTDSTYAIVGDALNTKAIDRICRIKGINPEKQHLAMICSDISMASDYCRIENLGFRFLKDYTPGAYTFLFKALNSLPKAFKGRKVAGIRIPDNTFARDLAKALGNPIITTSLPADNLDELTNPDLIAELWGDKVDFMVSDGDGSSTLTSIIDCTDSEPITIREAGQTPF